MWSKQDFVKWFLDLSDVDRDTYANSFLDVEASKGGSHPEGYPLVVLAKTYNSTTQGKVGLSVQGFRVDDGASGVASGPTSLVLTGLRASVEYRSNIAIFFADPSKQFTDVMDTGVTVQVFDATGAQIASQGVGLGQGRPFAQLSIDSLVKDKPGDLSSMSVVIDSISGSELIAAYATVIDNRTGDATLDKASPLQ